MVLSLLIPLSRAVGLCNLRFVPESGRFKRDNGPMLIYWIALHFIYLLVIPYVFVVRVSSSFHCQKIDILAVAYTVISVVKVFSLLLLIISIWVCRERWLRMGNRFIALQQLYRSDLRTIRIGQRLQHMWKLLMCLSKVILTMYSMYGPNSMLVCNIFEEKESPVSLIYIGSTIVALPLEMIVCCIDYWIYHLTRVSNWLLDCLNLEVQELKKDIGWLPRRRGFQRNVYQQQLFGGWRHLWRHCVRLDKVHREMIMIFQWQMLLNILTNYLTDITSLFNLIIYLNEPQTAHHIVYFIGYWITC
ncbi:putative gustatory receptor 58c [Drosophila nasuta]|uniref:putative gustatory receptor 58c n=1 Tax=Drosophila nasuta TaxID=42062 RepID=UPI00295E24ED|nr:putative gustatory receptor 58c [Drosophila nasuta]